MNTVGIERIRNAVLICASLGLLTGCSFYYIKDPIGFDLPDPPQWSFDSEDAPPMVEAATAVYVFEMPDEGIKDYGQLCFRVEGKSVSHNYFYYRFFPGGRVFLGGLPIDDAGLQRAIQPDGRLKLPEGLDFDDFHGWVGRYRLEGCRIELEFFHLGYGRWNLPFGVDYHYSTEEGELASSGFRITKVSERHRFSWNNRSYDTLREVRRTPVAGEMKRAATW